LTLEEAAVEASPALSLPDAATFSANLDDPTDVEDDAWIGPWALVHVDGIADLTISTSADVTFDAFRPADFAAVTGATADTGDETVYGRAFRGPPGFEVLVQAQGGDQDGQFTLNASVAESIFDWEVEP